MALASLLEPQLPMNGAGFLGFGAGSEFRLPALGARGGQHDGVEAAQASALPMALAAPCSSLSNGASAAGDAGIELLHGTTTLAFKVGRRRGGCAFGSGGWGVCALV